MHPFAYYALSASILTSALGAVVLCLLALRDGVEEPVRRQAVVRLGHAGSAVCFALTAGLVVVAIAVQSRAAVAAAVPPAEVAQLDRTMQEVGVRTTELGTQVGTVENRLRTAETEIVHLRAEQGQLQADLRKSATTIAELQRAEAGRGSARSVAPESRRRTETSRAPAATPSSDVVQPAARRSSPGVAVPAWKEVGPRPSAAVPTNSAAPANPAASPSNPGISANPGVPANPAAPVVPVQSPNADREPPRATEAASAVPQPVVPAAPGAPALETERSERGNPIARIGDEIGQTVDRFGRGLRRLLGRL